MTQKQRLLVAFKAAGRTGLTVVDCHRLTPPVLAMTARMSDLRREGWQFERAGRRHRCQVWRLVGARSASNGPTPTPSPRDADRAGQEACERQGALLAAALLNRYQAEVGG